MTENLWPKIDLDPQLRTPNAVLLEQANYLKEISGGKLIGEVERTAVNTGFQLLLKLRAPSLGNYTMGIAFVMHDIALYPAQIRPGFNGTGWKRCDDETALVAALGEILRSPEIVRIMRGLLTQLQSG